MIFFLQNDQLKKLSKYLKKKEVLLCTSQFVPLHKTEHCRILYVCKGIRQLQLILLKVALLLGVEVHVNVEFRSLKEPPENQENQSKIRSTVQSQLIQCLINVLAWIPFELKHLNDLGIRLYAHGSRMVFLLNVAGNHL